MSIGRFTEIALYSLISFLPYMIGIMYPFKNRLRFSKPVTFALIFVLCVIQIWFGVNAASFKDWRTSALSIISTVIYFIFYFLTVKANVGKMLFTLLMFSNLANFVVISSKCFEGLIFPDMAYQSYRWTFSLIMLGVQLLFAVPIILYIKNIYTEAINYRTDNVMWRYIWLIPATFYVMWYHSLYLNRETTLEYSLNEANVIFLGLIDIGSFLVYHIVVSFAREQYRRMELEEKNHILVLKSVQYENLRSRVIEARRVKHDIRHHFALMNGYLETKAYDELNSYLKSLMAALPEDSTIKFCDNFSINTILIYFTQRAKKEGIEFCVTADIPEKIDIKDTNISVLLGNLLENAVDACLAQSGAEQKIIFRGSFEKGKLIFTIDNTCENMPSKNRNGVYYSTKHSGTGIGIESVKEIVKECGGIFSAEIRDGMFCVSIML